MLYEEQILSDLESKGFLRDKVVRYLDANKHNHETTCYYLILKKLEREGHIDKRKYFSGENFLTNNESFKSRQVLKAAKKRISVGRTEESPESSESNKNWKMEK